MHISSTSHESIRSKYNDRFIPTWLWLYLTVVVPLVGRTTCTSSLLSNVNTCISCFSCSSFSSKISCLIRFCIIIKSSFVSSLFELEPVSILSLIVLLYYNKSNLMSFFCFFFFASLHDCRRQSRKKYLCYAFTYKILGLVL